MKPAELFHVTTEKKAKLYRASGVIHAPVRGFTTLIAALAWACKTKRTVIYRFEPPEAHKLPDHHNRFGEAWWCEHDVPADQIRCVFSAEKDA